MRQAPTSKGSGLGCGRVKLRTRRFYCRSGNCRRKIFAERFPNLTVAHGRQTNRHAEALKRIGYALGGEAGFQLASELGIDSSPDTILRILKRGRVLLSARRSRFLAWMTGLGKRVNAMEQSRRLGSTPADRSSPGSRVGEFAEVA
jgi:hypothetical protein